MSPDAHQTEEPPASLVPDDNFSPLKLLVSLVVLIYLAETITMGILYFLRLNSYLANTLLDGAIMVVLIFPGLYFFQLKPLLKQMKERSQAVQALRTSETQLKRVMEALPVAVWIIDRNGKIIHGNPACQEIWAGVHYVGMQEYSEYKGWRVDTGERIKSDEWAATRAIMRGESTLNEEINIEAFDGTPKVILNSAVPILDEQNAIQGAVVVNQDITMLKNAQKNLEEREALFRTAMENLPVGVWLTDHSGKIIYGNPAGQEIWAGARYVGKEEFGEYKGWWLSSGKRIEAHEWAVTRAIDKGETSLNEEIEIECFDGTHKIILNSAIPVHDEQGRILWAFVVNQDITARKQHERALIQTNELLERFFSCIRTLIAYMDRDFNFIRVNEAYADSAGHSPDFFLGKNHFDLYPNPENEVIFRRVVETGESFTVLERAFEYAEYPERGVTYWDWSLQPVEGLDGDIQGVVLSLVDVTMRKQAEIQLERQNRELLEMSNAEHKQRELAESLVQSTIALSSSLQLNEVLDAILEQIRRAIPFKAADVALLENRTVRIVGYHAVDMRPEIIEAMKRPYPLDNYPMWLKVYSTQQPDFIADTKDSPDWRIVPGMEWVRSFACAPLIAEGQVIGIINLSSDQPGCLDGEMAARLKAFAVPAALAIQNARLYMAESSARQIAETLCTTAQALSKTLDLEQVINTLLDHIHVVVHSDTAGVILSEDETHLSPRAVRGYGQWAGSAQIPSFPTDGITDSAIQRMISAQKSCIIPKMIIDSPQEGQPGFAPDFNWLIVPIIASGKVIGRVELGRAEHANFSPEAIQFAEALVGQAAVAIQNAWLFQQVRSSSERLQSLARKLVEIQEKEHVHIARELHDEAGQALSSLKLSLGRLEQDPDCPAHIRHRLLDLKVVADGVLESLHRLAVDLRPIALDRLGLVAALEQYANNLNSEHLSVKFKAVGFENDRLPQDLETSLYRIAQEALTNVVRHAQAANVGVLLERRENRVRLFVEDDGIGFTPDHFETSQRLGLVGMRERAEMFGGTLTIESSPGKGTSIIAEVPYVNSHTHRR